ncbi:MAG: hypothetical protein U9R74_00775 [Pseudomonadota bacterium]|nr:hypothetical protein [Pseudomonadota bacterium]
MRKLNGLRYGKPVSSGRRLKLDFSEIDREAFEEKRRAFHTAIQTEFFRCYRIGETHEHVLRKGESLWLLTVRKYQVPGWLLRQYNPDLKLNAFRAGMTVRFPVIERRGETGDQASNCTSERQQAVPDAACAA